MRTNMGTLTVPRTRNSLSESNQAKLRWPAAFRHHRGSGRVLYREKTAAEASVRMFNTRTNNYSRNALDSCNAIYARRGSSLLEFSPPELE
jgi:hypothetical protein